MRREFINQGSPHFLIFYRYRKYPDWVKIILIRKVTDIAAVGIAAKNEPERFETAFKDVPKENWYLFEDPKECYDIVKAVVAKNA